MLYTIEHIVISRLGLNKFMLSWQKTFVTETVQKAVEITVVDLKRFDLAKYARDKLSLSQRRLSWLLH